MVYHRLLDEGRISLQLEIAREGRKQPDSSTDVVPVNPFDYPESGDQHYPRTFTIDLGDKGKLKAVAHVWPKKSTALQYKLGSGKVAKRQGFYFYRNDRLIQAGGWNGVIDQDDEPHLSLARVEISLPPKMDDAFGLKVQKNAVEVPATFADAVEAARDGSLSFEKYRGDARNVYGRSTPKPVQSLPVVLANGVHPTIRARVVTEFGVGGKRLNKIKIKWTDTLEDGVFFATDLQEQQILLNQNYHEAFGGTATGAGGFTKALLFLLLREEFTRTKTSAKHNEWLAQCNKVLLAAWHVSQ